tara:strand:- start:328 stop:807 length:480 start_codon:yes stop_codon:yes gene_type:complete
MMRINIIFLIFLFLFPNYSSPLSDSAETVSFIVPIDVRLFSKTTDIRVSLYNSEEVKIMNLTAECLVSYDIKTQTESITCPKGIKYQEVKPEEFTFPIKGIIEIKSKVVRIGEKYRLLISGLSSDDCNSASTQITATANSKIVKLKNLSWMTTEMACMP